MPAPPTSARAKTRERARRRPDSSRNTDLGGGVGGELGEWLSWLPTEAGLSRSIADRPMRDRPTTTIRYSRSPRSGRDRESLYRPVIEGLLREVDGNRP